MLEEEEEGLVLSSEMMGLITETLQHCMVYHSGDNKAAVRGSGRKIEGATE